MHFVLKSWNLEKKTSESPKSVFVIQNFPTSSTEQVSHIFLLIHFDLQHFNMKLKRFFP